MRGLGLPLIAVLLVAAVLGVQLAAGGGDYVPRRPANPCTPRPVPPIPAQLEPLAERIVLLGLDSAACRLGVSRERRWPKVSRLLPEALDQTGLPGIDKTAIDTIPDGLIDSTLPTGALPRRTVDELDVDQLLRELDDPRRLKSAVRSAILHAALRQILDRLRP
jgi:hypothetical protein